MDLLRSAPADCYLFLLPLHSCLLPWKADGSSHVVPDGCRHSFTASIIIFSVAINGSSAIICFVITLSYTTSPSTTFRHRSRIPSIARNPSGMRKSLVCRIIQRSLKPLGCRCDSRIQCIDHHIAWKGMQYARYALDFSYMPWLKNRSDSSQMVLPLPLSAVTDGCHWTSCVHLLQFLPEYWQLWYPLFWNRSVRILHSTP